MSVGKFKFAFVACTGLVLIETVKAEGFQGFYLGANVGGAVLQNKYSYTNGQSAPLNVDGNGKNFASSVTLGLAGGYSHQLNTCFMLGAELFIDSYLGNRSSSSNTHQFNVKMERSQMAYGFLVRAGVMVNPKTLAYVGGGGKSVKSTYKIIDIVTNPNAFSEASASKRVFKPLIEAGLEGMFANNHLGWRASYNYTFSRSVKINNFPNNHLLNNPGDAPAASFSGGEHGVKVGVFYRF
ncbi:MAG: hypothetical protein K0R76_899 [Alphaproteobacteria bacterium]|jgi:opacity protein-like surface antigen|nr:hypothetical protein [Alphaproteobacteria bacterium]